MKVIKNINNNVSLCLDSQGNEIVAFGKGIGFIKPPYEIPLEKVERTFYDLTPEYMTILPAIDEKILNLSMKIIDYANRKLKYEYSSAVIFTLADHIQFAIKRRHNNIYVRLPIMYEVESLYPEEMKLSLKVLDMINKELHVTLPREEAASITLHLINFGVNKSSRIENREKALIDACADMIEKVMKIKIDKARFDYSRFVTHMYYLLERAGDSESFMEANDKMFKAVIEEYPSAYQCAMKIQELLDVPLNDNEILYLVLHINRLCVSEDCYERD